MAYFEKSSQEAPDSPASFCCPFYRSYLAITFEEAEEAEVQRYLAEARDAVGGSESKDELLKAVENLARALQESQRLKTKSVHEVADELNSYRLYCEKAAEYMTAAEEKAPGAVNLMRRCNPLLEDRIKATVAEIQEKAKSICEKISNTGEDEKIFCHQLNKEAKILSKEDYDLFREALSNINDLISQRFPDNQNQAYQKPIDTKSARTFPDGKLEELTNNVLDRLTVIERNVNSIQRDMSKPVKDKLTFKVPFIIGEYEIEISSPWIKRLILIIVVSIVLVYFFEPNLIPDTLKGAISKLGFNLTVHN